MVSAAVANDAPAASTNSHGARTRRDRTAIKRVRSNVFNAPIVNAAWNRTLEVPVGFAMDAAARRTACDAAAVGESTGGASDQTHPPVGNPAVPGGVNAARRGPEALRPRLAAGLPGPYICKTRIARSGVSTNGALNWRALCRMRHRFTRAPEALSAARDACDGRRLRNARGAGLPRRVRPGSCARRSPPRRAAAASARPGTPRSARGCGDRRSARA